MTRIEFVIDELTLIGFAPNDRHCIADAVERELSSLGAEAHHLIQHAATRDFAATVRAPDIRVAQRVEAAAIGAGVGRSIMRVLSNAERGPSHG